MTEMNNHLSPELENYLQIRYVKLHFSLEILRDGFLPRNKASALRGGMGRMLLMMNCLRDEKCDICDFREDCLVQRMMYPQMKVRPGFMKEKGQDSEGYVVECEDYEEYFYAGDVLEFNLLLFGRSIIYFTQFVHAFSYLGIQGLGKNHVPFSVRSVTNSRRQIVIDGNNIYKERLQIMMVADYVRYRLRPGMRENRHNLSLGNDKEKLIFHSPLALKYRGEMQEEFLPEAVLAAVERRLYILNCFEGRKEEGDYHRIDIKGHVPVLIDQRAYTERVDRYSGTHDRKVSFYGIKGYCSLSGIDDIARTLLTAGELVHIGKNTSFGFGRYTLVYD